MANNYHVIKPYPCSGKGEQISPTHSMNIGACRDFGWWGKGKR